MAMRVKFVDLGGVNPSVPYKLPINCAYWSLRMTGVGSGSYFIDGVDAFKIASGDADGKLALNLDFPPVFDEMGRPVMWNHTLEIRNTTAAPLNGCVILTYFDPALPER